MNIIYLDIETIPSQSPEYRAKVRENIKPPGTIKKPESIAAWMAENAESAADESIAKTSFDPAYGHICCLSFAIGDGPVQYYEARTIADEKALLENFYAALPKLGLHCFVGHYVAAFDLRFILCRSVVLGVRIPKSIPRDAKPWSDQVFDNMQAWAGARGTISQDNLAAALGINGKTDMDGSMVADAWVAGEYARIANYCMGDVETSRSIHRRFEAVGY